MPTSHQRSTSLIVGRASRRDTKSPVDGVLPYQPIIDATSVMECRSNADGSAGLRPRGASKLVQHRQIERIGDALRNHLEFHGMPVQRERRTERLGTWAGSD